MNIKNVSLKTIHFNTLQNASNKQEMAVRQEKSTIHRFSPHENCSGIIK